MTRSDWPFIDYRQLPSGAALDALSSAAATLGRKGGQQKSARKTAAARANATRPRPRARKAR